MNNLEECLSYFRQPVFYRFIKAWIEKYKRLGHLGGKIVLENLTEEEQMAYGLLLGEDLSIGRLSLTYQQFLKKWHQTKFEELDFLEILQQLQTSPLYTHQQLRERKKSREESFKTKILEKYDQTYAGEWAQYYWKQERQLSKYIHSYHNFDMIFERVCHALNHLPIYEKRWELLAVFAQIQTKDPHFFDQDLPRELLLKGIEYMLGAVEQERSVESVNEILYRAGLLRDDLSNQCYICHIQPLEYKKSWHGFYECYEPWNMNMYNLMKVDSLFEKKKIYIVENPSVFRTLVIFSQQHQLDVGFICSNGQMNLCTYLLIEKLLVSQCELYYAGDYDPEGLMIADKLKQKYPDIHLWGYCQEYLEMIAIQQSNTSIKRIQILKNIQNEKLKDIAQKILKTQSFGYQEGLLSYYQHDLLKEVDL